jgi:phosphoglycerate kinase
MKRIKDFEVKDKKVLVRCDFNVPLSDGGEILDDAKIREALPTLQYLLDNGAKIIITTHLGEPKGVVVESLKLNGVSQRLSELIKEPVKKLNDCIGNDVDMAVANMQPGEIIMLENVRFHKEETDNDPNFAKQLASLADMYVNEAFDVCHRNHASVALVPTFLPHAAGLLLEKEVGVLHQIMQQPMRPMVAIIGGKKVETKAQFVDPFCAFADLVIVSGLIKQELIDKKIPLQYPEKVMGPKDNLDALDIGDEDIARITQRILQAKTIFWNGPFGKYEDEVYSAGTKAIAKAIIDSRAYSVIGGGETLAFLHKEGVQDEFSYVSTAGGAMLEFLSGQELPGLKVLQDE